MVPLVGDNGESVWEGSYTGWSHFHPRAEQHPTENRQQFLDRVNNLPPLVGGYRVVPRWPWYLFGSRASDTYERREGYFVIAGLLCLKLVADPADRSRGALTGFEWFMRGAKSQREIEIYGGEWATRPHSQLTDVQVGTIHTVHRDLSPGGGEEVQNNYEFVVRSADEINWIVYSTHLSVNPTETRHRARLAEGRLWRIL